MAVGLTAHASAIILTRHTSLVLGYSWVKLHLGDPGADGLSNPASNTTRKQMHFGTPALGRISSGTNTSWTDTEVNATETYTHVSFWTAATGGTFGGSGPLTAVEVAAVNESFRIPAGSYTISLTLAT